METIHDLNVALAAEISSNRTCSFEDLILNDVINSYLLNFQAIYETVHDIKADSN